MGNCLDICVTGLSREETLDEFKGTGHPQKLKRSQPIRLEDVLLCPIPQQSAMRIHRDEENEKKKKKKAKYVTFSDEICIYGAQNDGSAEDSSREDGGEKGGGLRIKILLTKQEAAKLIAMSERKQETLEELLMQLRKEKELPTTVSDSPCQEKNPVLQSIPENGNVLTYPFNQL